MFSFSATLPTIEPNRQGMTIRLPELALILQVSANQQTSSFNPLSGLKPAEIADMLMELARKIGSDGSPEEKFKEQVRSAILARLDDPELSVADLARDLGLSRKHLHRKLKAAGAAGPSQFIREVRLDSARELMLRKPDLTISEVAYASGFSSPSYFTKCFQETFGKKPSEWN